MSIDVGTVSYGLACASFAALTLGLALRWRLRFQGSLLSLACLVTALWALALALNSRSGAMPLTAVFAIEIIRDSAWLLFLLRVLLPTAPPAQRRRLVWSVCGGSGLILGIGIALGILRDAGLSADSAGQVLIPGALVLAIGGLVLTHQVHLNTRSSHQWGLKFLWFGAGALFAYDLFMYSRALMFNGLDAGLWEARGAANALVVPLFVISILRTQSWVPGAFISQRLAFHAMSVVGIGIYLLAMALAGYYIRIAGGTWGGAAQILFLFGALLLLTLLLLSGQARAWFRVTFAKHFLPYRYDYRVEWLRLSQTLSAPDPDRDLEERAIHALAQIVNSTSGGIWLCRDERLFEPAGGDLAGPDTLSISADAPFLRLMAEREWIIDLGAARRSTGPRLEVALPDWLLANDKAWLLVPLLQEQKLTAIVAIGQPLADRELTWEDLDLLRTAARQVANYLALDIAARHLSQAQQFDAYHRFTAFVMHDLKNLMAQQMLVVENAARHKDNPQFVEDAIATIDGSVKRMSRLLEQLRRGEAMGQSRRVNVAEVCNEVAARCSDRQPAPSLTVTDADVEVNLSPERLALVLDNLVRNAQDATPHDGSVGLEVRRDALQVIVEVSDTGKGMEEVFVRERLFRPFSTTKGSQGMGIGVFQAREFARNCGGDLKVHTRVGKGSRFTMTLPLAGELRTVGRSGARSG